MQQMPTQGLGTGRLARVESGLIGAWRGRTDVVQCNYDPVASLRRQRLHGPADGRRGGAPGPAARAGWPQRRRRCARSVRSWACRSGSSTCRDPAAIAAGLKDVSLVLHCAGPFSATCAPMLEGCLAAGAHYLDITGEIDVFAHCHAQDSRARERGIVVLPGAGFDVVPTDCVAALLKRELPDATLAGARLRGGRRREPRHDQDRRRGPGRAAAVCARNGELVAVPLAYRTRTFDRDGRSRTAMTIPWGDLYTAWVSTGIPDIETYLVASPRAIAAARRANWLRPLLAWPAVVRYLQRRVEARVQGPSAETGTARAPASGARRAMRGARSAAWRSTRRTATTSRSPARWASSSGCSVPRFPAATTRRRCSWAPTTCCRCRASRVVGAPSGATPSGENRVRESRAGGGRA